MILPRGLTGKHFSEVARERGSARVPWPVNCFHTGMTIALGIIGGIYLVGFITMFVKIRNAPQGYQDETGLNIIWKNHSPGLKDIARIWS